MRGLGQAVRALTFAAYAEQLRAGWAVREDLT